jgi:hypothetical protein
MTPPETEILSVFSVLSDGEFILDRTVSPNGS